MSLRAQMPHMNPYDIHKALVNVYILQKPGDTKLLRRDSSKDKHDIDVIREHHKFLWDTDIPDSWEARLAKKYYDKLFKEYCIGDLSRYKENKVALRWRTEEEVVIGKGQFICGHKSCSCKDDLKTWEVNFAYVEHDERKNALVKIRLCTECSVKLNYRSRKREVKRLTKKRHRRQESFDNNSGEPSQALSNSVSELAPVVNDNVELPWENHKPVEIKSRDDEMEDYLHDLLF